MKKALLIAAVALLSSVGAQADTGTYAGVTLAAVHSDFKAAPTQNDAGFSAFVGHRYNARFSSEAAYSFLGGNVTQGNGRTADQHALSVAGRVHGPSWHGIEPFAKLGVGYTKLYDGVYTHKWTPVFGAGAEYVLDKKLSLRGEVQYIDNFAGAGNHQTTGLLGVSYKF